jgi:hypothetical protein
VRCQYQQVVRAPQMNTAGLSQAAKFW